MANIECQKKIFLKESFKKYTRLWDIYMGVQYEPHWSTFSYLPLQQLLFIIA